MKLFIRNQARLSLLYVPVLMVLVGIFSAGGCWAAAPSSPSAAMTPRAKLDRLLVCQQAEKDAALADKNAAFERVSAIESFIGSLSDQPKHFAAHERADKALTLARAALAKTEERLQLAERKIGMTVRALQYLAPEQGGVQESSPVADVARRRLNRLADGQNESTAVDGFLQMQFGFVTDPALTKELGALVNRLQLLSSRPDVPIQVQVLATESGYGALATATTIYFDKAYLDKKPSESELLFIASHELAHVQLGHFSETLIERQRDVQRLGKDLGQEGAAATGWRMEQALVKMRTGPWEQKQEEAADLLGAQQALEAGASPKGIQEAMLRMAEEEKLRAKTLAPDIQRYQESLRDHAEPLDRLKTLETALGEKFWERTDLKSGGACGK